MPVPEEIPVRLSRWCTDQVPTPSARQIGYTASGGHVTILDRRPPAIPELGAAWTSTPIAQLRSDEPGPGRWSLFRPAATDQPDSWEPDTGGPAEDPLALLARIEDAIRASAPPTRETGTG